MGQKPGMGTGSPDQTVGDIRRTRRQKDSAEEKILSVTGGLAGEDRIAELCRGEGIKQNRQACPLLAVSGHTV